MIHVGRIQRCRDGALSESLDPAYWDDGVNAERENASVGIKGGAEERGHRRAGSKETGTLPAPRAS